MIDGNKCTTCDDTTCTARKQRPGEGEEQYRSRLAVSARMCRIRHKVMVLSGKGGVGKSTVAVNLAAALALAGKRVGLLDIDIHGPSVPKLLHIEGMPVSGSESSIFPVDLPFGEGLLRVMSIGLLLRSRDDAVIWRGPRKYGVIKQFLQDVEWGDLDYLVVDSPPGTGDEPLTIAQLIEHADGALVVTTPQDLAVQDVRRCIVFCREVRLPVLGVVENMSGFTCPGCGRHVRIFGSGGGRAMAEGMGVPFLGEIPIEPDTVTFSDSGRPIVEARPHSATAKAINRIVRRLLEPDLKAVHEAISIPGDGARQVIAVPVSQSKLSPHFGQCEQFALFEVDRSSNTVVARRDVAAPAREPGMLPGWLQQQGANVIIAGGMGIRAMSLFAQRQIKVVVGAESEDPERIVAAYLEGWLRTGNNLCDH